MKGPRVIPRRKGNFSTDFDYSKELAQAYQAGKMETWQFMNYMEVYGIDNPQMFLDFVNADVNMIETHGIDRRSFMDILEYNYDLTYPDAEDFDPNYVENPDEFYDDRVVVLDDYGNSEWTVDDNGVVDNFEDEIETEEGRVYYKGQPIYKYESLVKIDATSKKPLTRSLRVSPSYVTKKHPEIAKQFQADELIYSGPFSIDLPTIIKGIDNPVSVKGAIFIDLFRQGVYKKITYKFAEKFDDFILDLILANDWPKVKTTLGKLVLTQPTFSLYYYMGSFLVSPLEIKKEANSDLARMISQSISNALCKIMADNRDDFKVLIQDNRSLLQSVLEREISSSREPLLTITNPVKVDKVKSEKYEKKIKSLKKFKQLDDIKNLSSDQQNEKWAGYCQNPKDFDLNFITKESKVAKRQSAPPPREKMEVVWDAEKANFRTRENYIAYYKNSPWAKDYTDLQWKTKWETYQSDWVTFDKRFRERKDRQKKIEMNKSDAKVCSFTPIKDFENKRLECKLENTIGKSMDMNYALSLSVYHGAVPSATWKVSNRDCFVGNASVVSYNQKRWVAMPKHFFVGKTEDSSLTFCGKTNKPVILSVKELELKHNNNHKDEDLVLTEHPNLIGLVQSHTVDPVRGKEYKHQVSLSYISEISPKGIWYSVGNVFGVCSHITAVNYNSEEGACGAPVIGLQEKIIGMHVATADVFNCFLSFAEFHFENLSHWDF